MYLEEKNMVTAALSHGFPVGWWRETQEQFWGIIDLMKSVVIRTFFTLRSLSAARDSAFS